MKDPLQSITEHPVKRELIVFLLIMAVAFAVYCRALSYGFLLSWDDPAYVVNNAAAHGFSWGHIKAAFSRFYVGNYAPLHIVSYMLDYLLWGLNPSGYRLLNIILHAFNGFMLYLLLRRLSLPLYPAIFSALLFVLHPVQVESVVWISQRKNVLAMLFFLLSIHSYSRYRDAAGGVSRKQYALSLLFFGCSLLAKSVVVVLPVILILYDLCISRRKVLQSIPDKLPFIFLALITGFIALLSQSAEYGGGGRADFHGGGIWSTLLTMLPVFITYLRMVLVPTGLSIVYAPQIKTAVDAEVLFSILILCSLSVVGCWLYNRKRAIFFWYAAIPLAILPVSQVIPLVTLMNDRYLYFPLLGVAACSGFLMQYLSERIDIRWGKTVTFGFFLLAAIYGFASFQRTIIWRSPLALWQDAAVKQPGSAVAWLVLGEEQARRGDSGPAEKSFDLALEICRGVECHHALEKLATLYLQGGRFDKAGKSADELIRLFPGSANGYIMKGYLKYQNRELIEAEKLFLEGVKLDPNQPSALIALGNIYLATGRPAVAREKLKAALALGSPAAELYYGLACAEAMLMNRVEALNYLDQSLRLGYNKPALIMNSPELVNLRAEPGFVMLMQSYFPGMNFLNR